MYKKLASLLLGIMVVFGLSACTDLGTSVSGYYVSVDINPSVEFVVDEDNNVESFIFLNDDAAILCADLDFTGMNIDEAVELFVTTATEAGYIDPDGEENAVLITVLGEDDDDQKMEQVRDRIRTRIQKNFARNYINGVVLSEDFTQQDLIAEAQTLGVSPGKLKLSYAALATDETLVLEDLLEMPVKDLLALVKEYHDEAWTEFKVQKMEQFMAQKQEKITANEAKLEQFRQNHPELTEEEVNQIVEQAQNQVRQETRDKWQERVETWKQHRNNENDNSQNPNDQEETNTEENTSDQSS